MGRVLLLNSKPDMDIKNRMWKGTDILYPCRVVIDRNKYKS